MIWLKSSEVSVLLGITIQAVHKAAREGKYGSNTRYENGRGYGGKVLMIALEALPVEIQDKWLKKNKSANHSGVFGAPLDSYHETKRKNAGQKLMVVEEFLQFCESGKDIHTGVENNTMERYLKECKSKYPELYISRRSLYRWISSYKKDGLEGIIDKRGVSRNRKNSIPEEVWKLFKKYYLNENQPSIKSCFQRVEIYANDNNIPMPSISTFERKVKTIPNPILIRWREGAKAFENKCMLYVMRDYTKIKPNQIWVTDHHQFDLMVIGPDNRLIRPWGTYFEDMRSRFILSGYTRCMAPNANVVLACFAKGVEIYGLPAEVILDNGKDYKVPDIFNNDDKARVNSIARQLDIIPHYALPYNAKTKPVERFFKTFEEQFGKLWKSYCGNQIYKRPERLKEMGLEEYPTFEEWQELHDLYIEKWYNKSPHRGQGMDDKPPWEIYHEYLDEKRTVPKSILRMLFMRTTKPLTVHRNGIKLFDKYFYSTMLMEYLGKKVYARYNPDNIETVYIYNEKSDTFICEAYCKEYDGWASEDYRQLKRDKKALSDLVLSYKENIPDTLGDAASVREIIEAVGERLEENIENKKHLAPVLKPVINKSIENVAGAAKKRKNSKSGRTSPEASEKLNTQNEKALSEYFEKALESMESSL